MPHTKSAKKAIRQDAKRTARNREAKKAIRLGIKKLKAVAKDGTPEQKAAEFKAVIKKLDKAAARKVMHKNAVARKVSQLARMVNTPAAGK